MELHHANADSHASQTNRCGGACSDGDQAFDTLPERGMAARCEPRTAEAGGRLQHGSGRDWRRGWLIIEIEIEWLHAGRCRSLLRPGSQQQWTHAAGSRSRERALSLSSLLSLRPASSQREPAVRPSPSLEAVPPDGAEGLCRSHAHTHRRARRPRQRARLPIGARKTGRRIVRSSEVRCTRNRRETMTTSSGLFPPGPPSSIRTQRTLVSYGNGLLFRSLESLGGRSRGRAPPRSLHLHGLVLVRLPVALPGQRSIGDFCSSAAIRCTGRPPAGRRPDPSSRNRPAVLHISPVVPPGLASRRHSMFRAPVLRLDRAMAVCRPLAVLSLCCSVRCAVPRLSGRCQLNRGRLAR